VRIKKRYLPDISHAELPHQKHLKKVVNLEEVLSKAAGLLKSDLDLRRESDRIPKSCKSDRDIYLMAVGRGSQSIDRGKIRVNLFIIRLRG
jgi:hypothetical protein